MDALLGGMDWRWVVIFGSAAVVTTVWMLTKSRAEPEPLAKFNVGSITLETLLLYSGYDYSKPILVAVKGKVYDVTKAADQYAPGRTLVHGQHACCTPTRWHTHTLTYPTYSFLPTMQSPHQCHPPPIH